MKKYFGAKGKIAKILPDFEVRESQIEMAKAVLDALKNERHLIVEAGTGTGKSLAYLIPAVLSGKKIVISTGTKNLQEQLLNKDIPLVQSLFDDEIKVCLIKGRANYLCHYRYERYGLQGNFLKPDDIGIFEKLIEWSHQTTTGDRTEMDFLPDNYAPWHLVTSSSDNCMRRRCPYFSKCFYFKLRERVDKSDIVIVNHYLFFADLAIRGVVDSPILPDYDTVIFDEAHGIEEVATEHLGWELSNYRIDELVEDLKRELLQTNTKAPILEKNLVYLERYSDQFFGYFHRLSDKQRLQPQMFSTDVLEVGRKLADALESIADAAANLAEKTIEFVNFAKRATDLKQVLLFIMQMEDTSYVYWYEPLYNGVRLKASPIDVSNDFSTRVLEETKTVILTSATLSTNDSFDFIRKRLGFNEKVQTKLLLSPFDFKAQTLLYVPRDMVEPSSPYFIERVIEQIRRLLEISQGRTFCLFTSYRVMNAAYEVLSEELPFTCFVQGEKPKSYLLEDFRNSDDAVLFATASFWQGVDVKGEALSMVIIDKLPFASPSEPIVEARIEYLQAQNSSPFWEYQVPSAILALKQGLGRLIRHRKDSGILAVLDQRLLTKRYGKRFLKSLPASPLVNDLEELERKANRVLKHT